MAVDRWNFRCRQHAGSTHVEVLAGVARETPSLSWALEGAREGRYEEGLSGDHTGQLTIREDGSIGRVHVRPGDDEAPGPIPTVILVPLEEWRRRTAEPEDVEWEDVRLPRSGDVPLAFRGCRVAAASSGGRDAARWHEIEIWARHGGTGWVLAIGYRSRWQGEHGHDMAVLCATPDDAIAALRAYDPLAHLVGPPDTEAYAARRQRITQALRAGWDQAVSDLADEIDDLVERLE